MCQPEHRRKFVAQFFSWGREKIPSFPGSSLGLDEVYIICLLNLPFMFALNWKLVQLLNSSARLNCQCLHGKKIMRVG